MKASELFGAMQAGKPVYMSHLTRCIVPVGPTRIIGMEPESGVTNITCWNVRCVDLATRREYSAFVRCEQETAPVTMPTVTAHQQIVAMVRAKYGK
jgi:hypothetical protein